MKKIDKPLYITLGRQLKEARLKKGYSLAYVGDSIGKSKASIKRYEDGVMRIDKETLDLLCNVLDVKPLENEIERQSEFRLPDLRKNLEKNLKRMLSDFCEQEGVESVVWVTEDFTIVHKKK